MTIQVTLINLYQAQLMLQTYTICLIKDFKE
jgi:hypothetical protein